MSLAAPWPTSGGDHRAANRGSGGGPSSGRVRWTWSAAPDAHLWRPLVDHFGRIYVMCDEDVIVLDAEGTFRRRLRLGQGSAVAAVVEEGLVAYEGRTLVCLDERGAVVWERAFDLAIRAVHVGPSGEVFVHTLERDGFAMRGAVSRIEPRGILGWTVPQAQSKVAGLAGAPQLAFDDEGVLYTAVLGRMGDGVSGDDVQVGGLAAYDSANGRARFVVGIDGWLTHVHGRARGAIVTGRTTRIIDSSGATLAVVDDEGRRERTLALDGRSITLAYDERLADAPILWQRHGPGSFGALGVVFDRAGNVYATTFEYDAAERTRLFALGEGGAPRWSLTLPPARGGTSIALGADANVVVVHGNTVLAVE